jgi:hypothetical protein
MDNSVFLCRESQDSRLTREFVLRSTICDLVTWLLILGTSQYMQAMAICGRLHIREPLLD